MSELQDRVAVISGAGGGQGQVAVKLFAEAGARLAITDSNPGALAEAEKIGIDAGAEVLSVVADVTKSADLDRIVRAVGDRYGRIDALYNNVGLVAGAGRLEDYTEEQFDQVFAINVKSHFFLTVRALALLRASENASIVNVASIAGVVGVAGATVYGASKGAVIALTKNLAVELAPDGIRVNCVASGTLDTPMPRRYLEQFPDERKEEIQRAWVDRQLFQRLGEPEELVKVSLFLFTGAASFITGAVINVDGGWLAS